MSIFFLVGHRARKKHPVCHVCATSFHTCLPSMFAQYSVLWDPRFLPTEESNPLNLFRPRYQQWFTLLKCYGEVSTMFVFPTEGGEPQLTVAGGWKRAWVLFCIFLETFGQPQMTVCLVPSQESPCQPLPAQVGDPPSCERPLVSVSEWRAGTGAGAKHLGCGLYRGC